MGTDDPIIDFGAGTGRLSIALARAGYPVLAVDVSEQSLAVLAATAGDLGLCNIEIASVLPSRPQYQAIVGADVLHHVDLDEYLPRMHSLLRAGGKVVFTEPGALNPAWYLYLPVFHELRSRSVWSHAVSSSFGAGSRGLDFATSGSPGSAYCHAHCSAGGAVSAAATTRWATSRC